LTARSFESFSRTASGATPLCAHQDLRNCQPRWGWTSAAPSWEPPKKPWSTTQVNPASPLTAVAAPAVAAAAVSIINPATVISLKKRVSCLFLFPHLRAAQLRAVRLPAPGCIPTSLRALPPLFPRPSCGWVCASPNLLCFVSFAIVVPCRSVLSSFVVAFQLLLSLMPRDQRKSVRDTPVTLSSRHSPDLETLHPVSVSHRIGRP
jgi:hypothetical protein